MKNFLVPVSFYSVSDLDSDSIQFIYVDKNSESSECLGVANKFF